MQRWWIVSCVVAASLGIFAPVSPAADAGFSFKDEAGKHLDVLLDGNVVARYMYEHDTSTPENRLITYKPYLHVFDAEGTAPITKGPGGEYTHHRGIFIGWDIITYNGKKYDRWHMKGGDIVHEKFLSQKADADSATFTSQTHWDSDPGAPPLIVEERTITIRKAPAPSRVIIDFSSKIAAPNGDVILGGDPEHAGIHFRPSDAVDRKATTYLYPTETPVPRKDLDYPWVGETFTLDGKQHSVVEMSSPEDPKGTLWSAYRNYGRFGAFPKATIKSGESFTFKYRFLLGETMPTAAQIEGIYDQFTNAATPSPVPQTSLKPAEKSGGPTTKPAAKPKASAPEAK